MSLNIYIDKRDDGYYAIKLDGRLDTNTFEDCESKIQPILNKNPQVLMFDMTNLAYISSMGLRTMLKTRKVLEAKGGRIIMINLQPQIAKVFEIAQALPEVNIFASVEEADHYFDVMQKKELEKQKGLL